MSLFVGVPGLRNVSWLGELSAGEHRDLVPWPGYPSPCSPQPFLNSLPARLGMSLNLA